MASRGGRGPALQDLTNRDGTAAPAGEAAPKTRQNVRKWAGPHGSWRLAALLPPPRAFQSAWSRWKVERIGTEALVWKGGQGGWRAQRSSRRAAAEAEAALSAASASATDSSTSQTSGSVVEDVGSGPVEPSAGRKRARDEVGSTVVPSTLPLSDAKLARPDAAADVSLGQAVVTHDHAAPSASELDAFDAAPPVSAPPAPAAAAAIVVVPRPHSTAAPPAAAAAAAVVVVPRPQVTAVAPPAAAGEVAKWAPSSSSSSSSSAPSSASSSSSSSGGGVPVGALRSSLSPGRARVSAVGAVASAVARARALLPEDESRVLEQATVVYDLDETLRSQRDPLLFRDYAADVMEHFRELEVAHPVSEDYLATVQSEVDEGKRAILVDWLVEVVEEYRLMPETLFMSVQFADRYLARERVTRANLQLVGIASMVLAGKMEEIWMPSLDDFINISDNTYTREQIVEMESRIAVSLGFRLKAATAKTFMHRFLRASGAARGDNQTALVKYLAELTLPETRFLRFRPSLVCASAVLVARRIERIEPEWTPTLCSVTGYSMADMEACVEQLNLAHRDAPHLVIRAIFDKYSHSPYNHVARTARPLLIAPEDPLPAGPAAGPPPFALASSARNLTSNTY